MADYCPECGKKVSANAKFCKSCGVSLKGESETSTTSKTPAPTPISVPVSKPSNVAALIIGIVIFVAIIYFSTGSPSEVTCPEKTGYASCGYCAEDAVLSSNPHAGKCVYCTDASKCASNPCDTVCGSNGGGGGGSTVSTYFTSCSGCSGIASRSIYYNGYSYGDCHYYKQLCDQYSCTNQKSNC